MTRTVVAVMAVVVALAAGAWTRSARRSDPGAAAGSDRLPATVLRVDAPVGPPSAAVAPPAPPLAPGFSTEAELMDRLRVADPSTVLVLAREARKRYPDGGGAEEREARKIDALVRLDRIGEAHTEAMLFVQRDPSGPFSAHVMNLMGVHPRPPGAVPEPSQLTGEER